VLVENKAGVLARVAGLFSRRGFNIYSLAVAPTDEDEHFSRITIVVDVESAPLEQVIMQLDKLVNVVSIGELSPSEAVERELVLVTVAVGPTERSQVIQLVGVFGGEVVSVGADRITVMLAGRPEKIDDFEGLLEHYPNLKGIISPTTVGILAAAQVVATPKWKGKVIVTGLGTPDEMKSYVSDGVAPAFILWNPANLGYLAAYAAVYLASKKITNAAGQSFTAGKLGKYTVGADNTVLLGPPTVFNSGNINKFNF